jgi:hypothetical protein
MCTVTFVRTLAGDKSDSKAVHFRTARSEFNVDRPGPIAPIVLCTTPEFGPEGTKLLSLVGPQHHWLLLLIRRSDILT